MNVKVMPRTGISPEEEAFSPPDTPRDKDDTRSEGDVKRNLLETHYASNPQGEREQRYKSLLN